MTSDARQSPPRVGEQWQKNGYGGANHLILTGGERHAIALTAVKALGLDPQP